MPQQTSVDYLFYENKKQLSMFILVASELLYLFNITKLSPRRQLIEYIPSLFPLFKRNSRSCQLHDYEPF